MCLRAIFILIGLGGFGKIDLGSILYCIAREAQNSTNFRLFYDRFSQYMESFLDIS